MSLNPNRKLKEKFRFLKKGEVCASPQKHKFKNIEFCFIRVRYVFHPQLRVKKKSDFSRRVKHVPHSKNTKFYFIRVRHMSCLTPNYKLKEKFRFLKKGETCVSPPITSLRKNSDFSKRVRHAPHPKNTKFCFIRVKHVPHPNHKLRKILNFSRMVRHVPHFKNTN